MIFAQAFFKVKSCLFQNSDDSPFIIMTEILIYFICYVMLYFWQITLRVYNVFHSFACLTCLSYLTQCINAWSSSLLLWSFIILQNRFSKYTTIYSETCVHFWKMGRLCTAGDWWGGNEQDARRQLTSNGIEQSHLSDNQVSNRSELIRLIRVLLFTWKQSFCHAPQEII